MNSKLGCQHTKTPLAAALSPFRAHWAHPTHDVNGVMCCVRVDHTTGIYVPYSFRKMVWVLLHHIKIEPGMLSALRRDLRFFVHIREDYRKSNNLQISLQRQHFLLSYLKTLSVGPARVQTFRFADLRSPSLANQLAIRVMR